MSETTTPEGAIQYTPDEVIAVYDHAVEALTAYWDAQHQDPRKTGINVRASIAVELDDEHTGLAMRLFGGTYTTPVNKPSIYHAAKGCISANGAEYSTELAATPRDKTLKGVSYFTVQRTVELLLTNADTTVAGTLAEAALAKDTSRMVKKQQDEYIANVVDGFVAGAQTDTIIEALTDVHLTDTSRSRASRALTAIACELLDKADETSAMNLFNSLDDRNLINAQQLIKPQYISRPQLAPLIVRAARYKNFMAARAIATNRLAASAMLRESLVHCQSAQSGRKVELVKGFELAMFGKGVARDIYGIPVERLLSIANKYVAFHNSQQGSVPYDTLPIVGLYEALMPELPKAYERLLESTSTKPEHAVENQALAHLFEILLHPEPEQSRLKRNGK